MKPNSRRDVKKTARWSQRPQKVTIRGIFTLRSVAISNHHKTRPPGRPGDVILGGGVEIVYVRTDVLDVNKSSNCLEKFVDIKWEPRKPTTYLLSVFSIESQIIPELEKLSNEASSDTIWKTRIDTAVEDWVRTLEWSSPDFNPEPSGRMNEVRTSVLENPREFHRSFSIKSRHLSTTIKASFRN